MRNEMKLRQEIRDWLAEHSKKSTSGTLTDNTNIIEERIISSLQIMDLLLFIERLTERPIDINKLKPGAFKTIETICTTFIGDTK